MVVVLTWCLLVSRIVIATPVHVLLDIATAPTLSDISLHRHSFSQPLQNERRTCGWSTSLVVLGHELHRREYLRVVPAVVSQYRRLVFDMCEAHARDVENSIAAQAMSTAHTTKFRKRVVGHPTFALSSTKAKKGVYNDTTLRSAIDLQRKLLSSSWTDTFDAAWG